MKSVKRFNDKVVKQLKNQGITVNSSQIKSVEPYLVSRHKFTRRGKYGAVRTLYNGYYYQSGLEARQAAELDLLMKAKDERQKVTKWERQFKIEFVINGIKVTTHYVDFYVEYADGRKELIETKGVEGGEWKIKRNLLQAVWLPEHPEITYRVVK